MVVISTSVIGENGSQTTLNGAAVTLDDKVPLLIGVAGGGFQVIEATVRELMEKAFDLEYTFHQLAPELYKPGDRISTLYGLL